ncbi:hypothetical protein BU24DRAFT_433124 [Aaosphaeria arxii CBS 175.79]|uniref:Fe2OG dioxygenase domain-containing protein n=1 Tax=Aaosphaeria arxii CBS 175.79 TaxID=1450172 RepID=A0A6A5XSF5_9PLEO|nr:uncharacterized protein BU24DRAFT_433124 [Aaosphaeria arxii CBS 175.79]KAF2015737.1 hypothetical protein BU24DRAFT_433124 [Aaosphaeria arxii CBS 175.79]
MRAINASIVHTAVQLFHLGGPDFDAQKHIAYKTEPKVLTMKDIGYADDTGVSPVAVSHPFQLFSSEAVQQMRAEIFKREVMENCSFSSNIAACQLRGYAPKYAPFTYDAWMSPETLAIISKIAGVDLVPVGDYEIAHINLSVKTDEQTKEELAVINKQKRLFADDEGIGGCPWEDNKPVVGWHTDSYTFVCVLMMSDCTNMVGGETALRTATGDVIKVRGPTEGCAVILQGRYITHQALRALGAKERITSVTSFRPRSAMLKDESVLATVRPVSDLSGLYYDFANFRLEILEERIRKERETLEASRIAQKKFDTLTHKRFIADSIAFLEHNQKEIVEEDKVVPGLVEEVDYPDVVVNGAKEARAAKRGRGGRP